MKLTYLFFLLITVGSCTKTDKQLTKITAKNISIDSTFIATETIENIISPYKEKLNAKMHQVLCYSPTKLVKKDGDRQSALGNLMADLAVEMADPFFNKKNNESIDFALFNYGGIRAGLPSGEIRLENAFELMPFENDLVVTTLTGNKISELADYFVKNKKSHPLSKNIQFIINENEYDLKINGKPFDKNKTYSVLTTDYLQGGGDRMDFFKNPKKLTKLDYKLRDAIIDYFKKTDTLRATIDNRIIIK